MNILSHAFVARTIDDDQYLFGTSLPDILSMYNRKLRIDQALNYLQNSANMANISAGINNHITADCSFHTSEFFRQGQYNIRIQLEPITQIPVKRFFLAHILFEMLLDRYLIKLFPSFLVRYYQIYTPNFCQQIASTITTCYQIPDNSFHLFLNRFVESRFLYSYLEMDQLVLRAARVIMNTGKRNIPLIDTETRNNIAQILLDIERAQELAIRDYFSLDLTL